MADSATQALSPQAPTRVRYGVLGFAAALSMITYMDRACMGSAAESFVRALGLSSVGELNCVFMAFNLAYALFEVPSGWLGDIFGPRNVLIRIVLWWSAFTAITGAIGLTIGSHQIGALAIGRIVITPLATLIAVRFLFGIGEAGAYPNITRALHNWFPFRQRGLAQGVVWMSGRFMAGVTPLVWLLLVEGIGRPVLDQAGGVISPQAWAPVMPWRAVFWLFGGVGIVWCILFALWFRNRPEQKPSVNAAELALIRGDGSESQAAHGHIPWRRLLTSGNLWAVCIMYTFHNFVMVFHITYLPNFLKVHYGASTGDVVGALYKGGPLWLGAAGCLAGGFLTDWFIRRTGNRRWGRRLFGLLGNLGAMVCFLLCAYAPSAFSFFLVISLAGFFTDVTMGANWAVCQDIGRRYAAIVAGCMNMIGNLGGTTANWITGYFVQRSLSAYAVQQGVERMDLLTTAQKAAGELPGYHASFCLFATVCLLGALGWLLIDPTKPVAPDEPA